MLKGRWKEYVPLLDLSYIRLQSGQTISDEDLTTKVLDPKNSTPPDPNSLFDCAYYADKTGIDGANPILHYIRSADPVSPHPLLDHDFYRNRLWQEHQELAPRPLEHFLTCGFNLGLAPSPWLPLPKLPAEGSIKDYLQSARTDPHPLIDMDALCLQYGQMTEVNPALMLSLSPERVPINITPLLDTEFYASRAKNPGRDEVAHRQHYFRHGFFANQVPNAAISAPYILNQCMHLISDDGAVRHYLASGMHRRPRLLLVFDHLNKNLGTISWLKILERLLQNDRIETIVVTRSQGELYNDFRQVAHVWHMGGNVDVADLQEVPILDRSFRKLMGLLAGNLPRMTICVLEKDATLFAIAQSHVENCLAMLGAGDDLKSISEAGLLDVQVKPTLFLGPSLAAASKETPTASGIMALPSVDGASGATRADVINEFELPEDALIVLGAGLADFDSGIDAFANVAAQIGADANVRFLWFDGQHRPDNPSLRFAQHRMLMADMADRFIHISAGEFQHYLQAADIFVHLAPQAGVPIGLLKALSLGVPVLAHEQNEVLSALGEAGALQLAGQHDVAGAAEHLKTLISDAAKRNALARRGQLIMMRESSVGNAVRKLEELAAASGSPMDFSATEKIQHRCFLVDLASAPEWAAAMAGPDDFAILIGVRDANSHASWLCQTRCFDTLDSAIETCLQRCARFGRWSSLIVAGQFRSLQSTDLEAWEQRHWYLRGGRSETDEVYRLGPAFDGILVGDPAVIDRMKELNEDIVSKMRVVEGQS